MVDEVFVSILNITMSGAYFQLSDDDDDDTDNSVSSDIIEAIQNAIENQNISDEIVTNVITYKNAKGNFFQKATIFFYLPNFLS